MARCLSRPSSAWLLEVLATRCLPLVPAWQQTSAQAAVLLMNRKIHEYAVDVLGTLLTVPNIPYPPVWAMHGEGHELINKSCWPSVLVHMHGQGYAINDRMVPDTCDPHAAAGAAAEGRGPAGSTTCAETTVVGVDVRGSCAADCVSGRWAKLPLGRGSRAAGSPGSCGSAACRC
jgi:hypothetical protein